jgi:RNA-directed DNA polymerase
LNLLTIKDVAKMRKGRKRQKYDGAGQYQLFDAHGNPAQDSNGGTEENAIGGVELSSRLEQQRTLTQNILERIVDSGNIDKAYKQVRGNKGSAGVDNMNVEELRRWLGENYQSFQRSILEEKYEVSAVRKIELDKPEGGKRLLGIPTVTDRLIQQSIFQQLNTHYDPYFSENSYGFRPNRGAHQAIRRASEYIKEGKEWVVDIDLEKFFDKINHDRLMQRLSKGIGDKRLLRLINAYLKTGLMSDGLVEQRTAGTPQGSPLSPLLSNIILDELDKELEKRGLSFCRYADDCNIFVTSHKAGERVLESITKFIEVKLKLKVNKQKSGVRHCSDVKYLGYTIMTGGKIRVADKSVERPKLKIKELTKRNKGESFQTVINKLNMIIVGWTNYYILADGFLTTFRNLDGWLRRKLRCYRLKQCKRKYSIFKFLLNLGIPERESWNAVMYSQGWWKMSIKVAVSKAMSIKWFAEQGLQSLYFRMQRAS